jgi:hypothetical protein
LTNLFALLDSVAVIDLLGLSDALVLITKGGLEIAIDNQTDSSSHRFKLLQELLLGLPPESRAIVFVSSRKAVHLLHRSISTAMPWLNALFVVGHGDPDGMDWEDGQETAIAASREGTSQLLISTSVLEEGLDVTDCDIVVRFSGFTSLIQFIQSRGRASCKKGKIMMILTEEEQCRLTEIESQERILYSNLQTFALSGEMPSHKGLEIARQLAIHSVTGTLSSNTVGGVYEYIDHRHQKVRIGWKCDKDKNGDTLAVEMFIFGRAADPEDIAVSVEEHLFGCVVSRCEMLPVETSPAFLGGEVTVILLQLKSKVEDISAAHLYEQLIKTWDFITSVISRNALKMDGREGRKRKVLSKIYRPLDYLARLQCFLQLHRLM